MERDEREDKPRKRPAPSRAELRRRLQRELHQAQDDIEQDQLGEPLDSRDTASP